MGGYINERENIIRLIDSYQRLIFSICYKITADYFVAEDLTQETYISAYQNLDRITESTEKAYLARIATNKSIDYQRKKTNHLIPTENLLLNKVDYENQPEKVFIQAEILADFRGIIGKLKPPYDEIAMAYYMEEKTPKEIADERNQNLKTVQTQIYRAREKLKALYRKEVSDEIPN